VKVDKKWTSPSTVGWAADFCDGPSLLYLPPRMRTRLAAACALALLGVTPACKSKPAPETPETVIREFLDAMQKNHGDPKVAEQIYRLLWQPARKNLEERARRASALSGRPVHPSEMIVPSWFTLRTTDGPIRTRIEPPWAEVTFGDGPNATRARLMLEEGHYRVALELPAPAPIRSRPNAGD
jgi:hypothetical protein